MFSFPRSLALWVLLPLAATPGFAATSLAEGYAIRVWRTEDGLPQNTVTSAVQTRDGYLWFGTQSGLVRFDGERFQVFDTANTPGLPDPRITCLFEDDRGTIWIGQETDVVSRDAEGRFKTIPLASEADSFRFIGIGSDEHGRLWAMRQSGSVESLAGGHRLPSVIAPAPGGFMTFTRNDRGNIWLIENSLACRLEDGRIVRVRFDPARENEYVGALAASRDGGVWVLLDGRIRKWDGQRWSEDRGVFPGPFLAPECLELRDGTLALGTTDSGLYLIFPDGEPLVHLDASNGLPQNWIRSLYEDREGNLWVGTGNAGLASIRPTALSVLSPPDRWQGYSVNCVAPGRDGSLWVGSDGGGLYHYSAGHWSHYGVEGVGNPYIWAVTESPSGEVWMGNYWWGGPYRLEQGRFVRPAAVEERSPPVLALLTDRLTGDLLVGRRDGVVRLHGNDAVRLINASDYGAADAAALAQDQHGAIWCAFAHGGLARVANGKISLFRRKDGLPSETLQCLLSDSDGALWIGTAASGISRFKNGRFTNLNVAHGLIDNAVCHIVDDGIGNFWLSTHHGLQRVAKADLNRCADREIARIDGQAYDENDGLPMIEFAAGRQAAGCRSADGRLWFPSAKALVSVDPARISANPTPPPVVIESLLIDGKAVSAKEGSVREAIAPDHQRLEFRFSGLSYVSPNRVLFKHRLDGVDRTWVDAGSKRTAFYSKLPAGTYRFRVIACNSDGAWNLEGAALAFTVAPFFWETWWFIGSSTLLVLLGVALFVRFVTRRRMQKRLEQLERQSALERERARIAQDIHDDIGTSLIRIAMFSQPERNELEHPQQTAAILSRIYSTAREMTRALDEIVWAIDPRHDTLDSLIRYMGRFAQELLGAVGVRCRLDVPLEVPAWPLRAEIRHNLFLAFKEALNNVVKHAGATEVRITLEVHSRDFVFRLRDNGRGFDREQPISNESGRIASGNGLRNIEGRISRIGGRCEISSEFGKGTVITFEIPVHTPVATSAPGLRSHG
jgi:signal transduction histidine kinase/ligand-binding sensor domain-containing protein